MRADPSSFLRTGRAEIIACERGAVLGIVMVTLVVMSIVGLALIRLSETDGVETASLVNRSKAFWSAEAGLQHVRALLAASDAYRLSPWEVSSSGIGYRAASVPDGGSYYIVTSTGNAPGRATAVVTARCLIGGYSGAFGGAGVTLSGGSSASGTLQSNGDIDLTGGSAVTGDAVPGPGKSVLSPERVSGSTTPAEDPVVLDPISPQALADVQSRNENGVIPASYMVEGKLFLDGGAAYTLPEGTYFLSGIEISGGSVLTTCGAVKIYSTGPIIVSGGAIINPSHDPGNLRILATTAENIDISGSSDLHGHVYAPNASECRISGGGSLYGSVVLGGTLEFSGGSSFFAVGWGKDGSVVVTVDRWKELS